VSAFFDELTDGDRASLIKFLLDAQADERWNDPLELVIHLERETAVVINNGTKEEARQAQHFSAVLSKDYELVKRVATNVVAFINNGTKPERWTA
jgi:hypothetical protein|tara:strand:+ start:750 stop:1034 length:285 start_codon:yes stop_codon:yes gene_type:complete